MSMRGEAAPSMMSRWPLVFAALTLLAGCRGGATDDVVKVTVANNCSEGVTLGVAAADGHQVGSVDIDRGQRTSFTAGAAAFDDGDFTLRFWRTGSGEVIWSEAGFSPTTKEYWLEVAGDCGEGAVCVAEASILCGRTTEPTG